MNNKTTTLAKPGVTPNDWYVVDAADHIVGRLASRIATVLMGKHKPSYTPYADMGDHVVVINADRVVFTGRKGEDKLYRHHSMYPGGLKATSQIEMRRVHPERILTFAVKRMLPKTNLGRSMMRRLKIYAGAKHPHTAQAPLALDFAKKEKA